MSITEQEQKQDLDARHELPYKENWYRVLKALSLGEPIELGEVLNAEIAELTFDPEVIHRVA